MFRPGDKVFILDTAQDDVGGKAWQYVDAHREATVKCKVYLKDLDWRDTIYCVEFEEVFPGGWDCYGACEHGKGQQVTGKHLELRFEASREVTTAPNIERL